MNKPPRGKIGHLPKAVQDQVNRRLENGEQGRHVVAWLNSLPEVQAVLVTEFAGHPITQQNLSEWRKRAYRDWLRDHEARAMTQELASSINSPPLVAPKRSEGGSTALSFTDDLASWTTAHYLMAIRNLVQKNAGAPLDLPTLRHFLHDVVAVRRGDHRAARLKLLGSARASRAAVDASSTGPACASARVPAPIHQSTNPSIQ
jgi:hypothetical protein